MSYVGVNLQQKIIYPLNDPKVPENLRVEYQNARDESRRGFIFEKIAAAVLGFTETEDRARLDGIKGNTVYEIKSRIKTLSFNEAAQKVVGAALGIGSVGPADESREKILTAKSLTTGTDTVDFGDIVGVEDAAKVGLGDNKPLTKAERGKFKTLQKKAIAGKFADTPVGTADRRRLGQFRARQFSGVRSRLQNRASGGGISGTDTVPALLTPGEFVFNKKAASRIGYGNLNRMNKDGVQGLNKGGVVGFQRGGKATGGGSVNFDGFQKAAGQAVQGFGNLTSTALLLQGTFSSTGSLFEEGGLTFSNVIGSVTNSLFAFQAVLQTLQTAQALGGLTNLAGNLKSLKNLPANLKGINKTITGFGKSLKSTGDFARAGKLTRAGAFTGKTASKSGQLLGKGAGKLGSLLNKLPKGQLINKAGASVIGKVLAAGVAAPLAAALTAIPIGQFVGEALGTSLDKALFGAREEVAGFQGREGQSSGDAAASGAVKEGFATAGLGAGIGAAIGSIIPGIGTAIGAAAGAGIGAVIGGATGIIVGSINGPLEQASFEAAKKIQTSQEEVGKSLEAFSKSGSLADYDAFINDFIDAGDAQNQAFKTFTNQFDNEVSVFDLSPFNMVSNAFSALSNALQGDTVRVTKSQTQAIERIESLIDPKQVEAARKGLSQGLQKLADTGELDVDFQGIDFSTREGQQEGRARLKQKASEDPEGRAAKFLEAENKQIKDELSVAAKQFKDGSGFFGFFKSESQKTGEALTSLRAAAESGQVDIQDEGQVSAFLEKFGDAGAEAAKELDKIKESGDGALGAAISAGLLSKALREAEQKLNEFNSRLKTIQDDLAFATASSALAMTNLKDTTDALSNGQILFTKKLDGFDFGKAGAGARQDRIAAIGQATDVDVEGIQKFDTVISNADDIGKDVFKDLKKREVDGKASLQDVTSALEKGIEKELGFELPEGPLKEGLKKSLEGFGRQLGDGSDIPLDKLGEAIEDGKVAELLGPAFAEVQNTTKALSETFNQLNSIAAEEANLRLQIAQEEIKRKKEVRKRERGIEDTAIDPEKAFKGDPLKLAQKRLDEDIADLGFADKSAVEIAKAQQVARDKQLELNEKLQSGAISADEFAIQAGKAASENANASAALNQLANDTTQLSAIQQKAAKLIANRDASRKQATDELVARETGDVIGIARRRESSRMVQAGLADGASQGDRRRLLVAAAQDQSLQQEIALQERMRDPEGTSGKTAQQIFDETLIKDLEAQAAIETDPLEKARIEQQIEDIKAPGLEELQKQAVDVQRNQLAVQELIASNQQLLLAAQLAGTEEEKAVLQAKLTENTQKLNGLLQNNEKTAQEQQALNETLEPTPVTTAGAAGGVITPGNLGGAITPSASDLLPVGSNTPLGNVAQLVSGNTGFNPTEEQILRASGPSPQEQFQQGSLSSQEFAAIMQESVAAFTDNASLMQAAAELQNQASERQLEAANGMPTQIAHNVAPVEMNGFADLPRALDGFTNNIGEIAQRMIDPSQQYQGPSDQGGGIDIRTLG